jgi:ParB family chromosome partitioning protein
MTASPTRALSIDDPVGGREVCHVAHPGWSPRDTYGRLRDIRIDDIRRNADQPRKHFDKAALDSLAESIRERGVLQPIIVRLADDDRLELVAGERRWRAAKLAGLKTIPALIDETVDGGGSLELALIENVVREDLTPIEEARTIAALLQDLGVTAGSLSKRLGRSRSDLVQSIRLLDLPDEAIELIDTGALTKGHGKALLTAPDHHRRRSLAKTAAREGWSVRALEAEIARSHRRRKYRQGPSADHAASAARLEDALSKLTGSDIRARPHRDGYQLLLDQQPGDRLIQLLSSARVGP